MGKLVTKNTPSEGWIVGTGAHGARSKTEGEMGPPSIDDYKAGRTKSPLYDRERDIYPTMLLPPAPVDETNVDFVNWNWAMARTIALLKANRLSVSQAGDVMKKAELLFQLSYFKVYGEHPRMPPSDIRDANR